MNLPCVVRLRFERVDLSKKEQLARNPSWGRVFNHSDSDIMPPALAVPSKGPDSPTSPRWRSGPNYVPPVGNAYMS